MDSFFGRAQDKLDETIDKLSDKIETFTDDVTGNIKRKFEDIGKSIMHDLHGSVQMQFRRILDDIPDDIGKVFKHYKNVTHRNETSPFFRKILDLSEV